MRRRNLLAFTLLVATCVGAALSDSPDVEDKLDPQLRAALIRSEHEGSAGQIRVAVLVRVDPGAEFLDVEKAGLTVETVAGTVATAHGTLASVRRAAALVQVRSISLSQLLGPTYSDDTQS